MADVKRFAEQDSVMAPATGAYAITPSDTVNEAQPFRSIYVGTTGNISVRTLDDQTVVFPSVAASYVLPIQGKRVNVTNTTASSMIGLY
jgi:hypothetical protein